ncbi:MAG: hypothetical protein H6Q17_1409 [Bacteroidetes bacterium]|nr:hypothetical protein [Bacteroidota bacterium]
MKLKATMTVLLASAFLAVETGNAQTINTQKHESDSIRRAMQLSFLPYIGTDGRSSGKVDCHVSFNILAGTIRSVDGFEMGGLLNMERRDAGTCQLAGIGNIVGGKTKGFQASGIFNQSGSVDGVQMAGIVNNTRKIDGVQMAGIANNKTEGNCVQMAGIANNAQHGKNAQITGIINTADSASIQIAGIANYARNVNGTQIAGLVNVAKRVKGCQIGVINISDSCGTSIGIINIVKNGIHQLDIYGDELFYSNIAFRSGTSKLYTLLTAGIRPDNLNAPLWTYGWGIGTSCSVARKTALDFEGVFSHIVKKGDFRNNFLYKVGVNIDQKLGNKTSLIVGLTYNFLSTDTRSSYYNSTYSDMAHYSFTDHTYSRYNLKSWLGVKVGLRFF